MDAIKRAAEIRAVIALMQPELPPAMRVDGTALREWQNEAASVYLTCRRAAERGLVSPYAAEAQAHRMSRARG